MKAIAVARARRSYHHDTAAVTALGLVAAATAGIVVALGDDLRRPALIAALAVLAPLPIIVRVLEGRFDIFEPINFYVLGIVVLFVLRPIFELSYDSRQFPGGYSDYAGFDGALGIAVLGTLGIYVGYALDAGRRIGRRLPPVPTSWSPDTVGVMAIALVALGALLYAAFAAQLGQGFGATLEFFKGRSTESPALRQGTAYFYLGPYLVIPATLLLLVCWRRARRVHWLLAAIATGFLALLITVPRGDRTYVLTLLLPLVVLPYLRSGTRPRAWKIVLVLAVLIVPTLNVLLEVRNVTARANVQDEIVAAFTHPTAAYESFMLGVDTSMFTVLALTYESVPARVEHVPGRVITATLAGPVPSLIWPDKPVQGDQVVYSHLFPEQAALTRAGNGSGVLGGFYFDSGLLGVCLYAGLVGMMSRAVWEWWRTHNAGNVGVNLVFASLLPFIIVLQRGNLSDSLGRSIVLVLPIIVVLWLASRRVRVGGSA